MLEFSIALGLIVFFLYNKLFTRYKRGWAELKEVDSLSRTSNLSCSIIIAFRNESDSLPHLFKSLKELESANIDFEIILVDDHSSDNSFQLCENWANNQEKIVVTKSSGQGKKAALDTAISASKKDIILCTDADVELKPAWLMSHLSAYSEKTQLISGPVQLEGDGSLLHNWQELEFLGLIGIGAASIFEKRPNMCNGANISFRKKAFQEVDGYHDNQHLLSGDDEFLMHKIAKEFGDESVIFLKDKKAIVCSETKSSLSDFLSQRMRWSSKATHYKDKRILFDLVVAYFASFLALVYFFFGLVNPVYFIIFLVYILAKALLEYSFYLKVLPFFGKRNLTKWFLISELIQVVYVSVIGVLGTFVKFEWKGRRQ